MIKSNRHSIILKIYFFVTKYFEFLFFLLLKYRLIKGKNIRKDFWREEGVSGLSRPSVT